MKVELNFKDLPSLVKLTEAGPTTFDQNCVCSRRLLDVTSLARLYYSCMDKTDISSHTVSQ